MVNTMFEWLFKIEDNWVVFFDLFSKNGNGDSIRPIAEELRKQRPDMKFFFCDKRKKRLSHIDMADEIITEKTLRFKYVCSKAKYIISPMGFPNKGKKRNGQIFIQTFHGSPVKRCYLARDNQNRKYKKFAKLYRNTDIACAQSEFFKPLWIETYGFENPVIFTHGVPRNDILFTKKNDMGFIENLKKELGLPENKKVILYCPTWRRYDYKAILPFDMEYLKKELSDEYVLLMRSHVGKHEWVNSKFKPVDIFDNKFCYNGGDYPEITHLYLITDIMISDYSSAIWDFSITGKPQILYTYDYESFSTEFKLHFNYSEFFPFPQVKDQKALVDSIKNYPDIQSDYNDFCKNYLNWETGNATENLIREILKS